MSKTLSRSLVFLLIIILLAKVLPAIATDAENSGVEKDYIKWVDFTVPKSKMEKALEWDIKNREGANFPVSWVEILAYLGTKCGGDFKKLSSKSETELYEKIAGGKTIEALAEGFEHYDYYLKAYTAVLGGFVGDYSIEAETDGLITREERYGLKAYHPIAKTFPYSHFDDFGTGRNYGYKRKHLGHDFMAATGTPVIAVETGIVEELGWNQYGGWRIGIRSFCTTRYYYYAHLRQNRPFAEGLEKGQTVFAGDVIGYVGRTGYSSKENTNGIEQSHLHFGLQLIFDESQKDGVNQIWVDVYEVSKLLERNKSEVARNDETKEWSRVDGFSEAIPEQTAPSIHEENELPHSSSCSIISLPVIMYHAILENKRGKYAISPAELEEDFKWMTENGYQTVTTKQLIDYAENGTPLPDKPVFLSFDDGHYNNDYFATELLKKYGFTAAVFVVGDFIEKTEAEGNLDHRFSYSTRENLKEMAQSGVWEIESHSYSLHNHKGGVPAIRKRSNESEEAHKARLRDDLIKIGELIEDVSGRKPVAFAYPFGDMNDAAEEILRETGYKISLSCTLGIAEISDSDSLFKMKRLLRSSGTAISKLIEE